MAEWSEFAAAFLAFFMLHSVPLRPRIKSRIVSLTGPGLFTLVYSCVSILALSWLVVAASRAPYVELWEPARWQYGTALIVMFAVSLIIAFSVGRPNPFSFGGSSRKGFEAAYAGIVRLHRHPMLLALFLWAGAHLLPNGDLAHVILFGLFAGFSLLGMKLIDRRTRRRLGVAEYKMLLGSMRRSTLVDSFAKTRVITRIAVGVSLYLTLLLLHPLIIGVSPLAPFS